MKLSAWVAVGDLIQKKKTFFERFVIGKFIFQNIFYKKNPSDVLLSLKKSGVDGIELLLSSKVTKEELQKIKNMIEKLDMLIFSVHQPLSTLFNISINEVKKLSKITKNLKAKVLVLHINVIGKQIFDKKYIMNLKDLERQYGIKISIENSPKSVLTILNSYCWQEEKFSKLMDVNELNITFDITHVAQVGGNIISFYKNNKERIVNIHLSDYKEHFLNTHLLLANHTHLPLRKGNLPIKDFLQTLKEKDYNGLITMEINGSLEELCQSAKLIKRLDQRLPSRLLHLKNSPDNIKME